MTCELCKGTGLVIGPFERDGAAIVCKQCYGTGSKHGPRIKGPAAKYFHRRVRRRDVVRVFAVNPGIKISITKKTPSLDYFGGLSYEDWYMGTPFRAGDEMRNLVCPAWWYQAEDSSKQPNWKECTHRRFSMCRLFKKKSGCWMKWDAGQTDNKLDDVIALMERGV